MRPLWLAPLLCLTGCGEAPLPTATLNYLVTGQNDEAPTEEFFVALPVGLPTACGPALRAELTKLIEGSPAGTRFTFFFSDTQEWIASFEVPQGSASYRQSQAEDALAPVWDRLDPELAGGSQDVELIALPASVRKYRKSDLPPRVVVVGSLLTVDREGNGNVTASHLPCDGCATDAKGCYARMEDFPEGTRLNWLTPAASWGNGPAHRNQVERHQRYVVSVKQAEIVRITSDASIVFDFTGSQWDEPVAPHDDCNGQKKVDKDPPKTKVFDQDGNEVVQLSPGVQVKVQDPDIDRLKGQLDRVVFLLDVSGSVAFDAAGNPQPAPFNAMKKDSCEKVRGAPFRQFAIIAFQGDAAYQPRISHFPHSIVSGVHWLEATPANREQGVAFIERLAPGGGTPTRAALAAVRKLEGPMAVCLYSDGIPTLGEGGMEGVLEDSKLLKKAGVVVNAIGVGALSAQSEQFDYAGGDFLARLSLKTDGDYFALATSANAKP